MTSRILEYLLIPILLATLLCTQLYFKSSQNLKFVITLYEGVKSLKWGLLPASYVIILRMSLYVIENLQGQFFVVSKYNFFRVLGWIKLEFILGLRSRNICSLMQAVKNEKQQQQQQQNESSQTEHGVLGLIIEKECMYRKKYQCLQWYEFLVAEIEPLALKFSPTPPLYLSPPSLTPSFLKVPILNTHFRT